MIRIHMLCVATILSTALTCMAPNAIAQPDYREREERHPRDFLELLKTFGADGWAVIRSPLDASKRTLLTTTAVLATFAVIYQYDGQIQDSVRLAREENDVIKGIEDFGTTFEKLGLMGETNRYYALGIAVGYTMRWEKLERVSTDILFSHFIGGLVRQAWLRVVDRSRPNENKGPYNYGDGGTSLPSGHSSTIFQLATVLSHHFPAWWAKTVFYGIATSVAMQRVIVDQHFASDSFLGAAYGHAIGRIIVGTNDRRGYLVTPVVMPASGAVGLSLQFQF
jgi:hypothetical protein